MLPRPVQPLRALIYNRVSADPAGNRVSVASQDEENRAFCARQHWEVVGTITDNDRSASRFAVREREGYARVRATLAGTTSLGRIDVLVAWESSRAQRDLADYVTLRDLCVTYDVLFAYKGRVYDMRQGDDRFATGIDALVDEREAERIRERTLRGHRTSVAQGKPRGFAPYGYRREYDLATGRLLRQVPDPPTAAVVAELVRRLLGGATLYELAKDLNARGEPTPRQQHDRRRDRDVARPGWSSSQIRHLLSKPSLMGIRTHHGLPTGDATWEPIVDPADWARVQALLADPQRAAAARGVEVAHLMSGIAECGVCGGWLRPLTNRGRPTYVCGGVVPTAERGHVSCPRPALDELVTETVLAFAERGDILTRLVADERDGGDETAAAAAREAATLQARLDAFIASAADGGVTPQALAMLEARLRPQIEDARRRAVPRSAPPVLAALTGADVRAAWAGGLDLTGRRQVIRHLMRVIVRRAPVRGAQRFDPSRVQIVWRWA